MKKYLTYIILLTLPVLAFGQLENGSFENWELTFLYEDPENYATTNKSVYALVQSEAAPNLQINVTRVAGAQGSAARLESAISGFFSLPGLLGTDDIFTEGFQTIPYTGTPDGVDISIRYDIAPEDTAVFSFIFFNNGNIINTAERRITGSRGTFENETIDFGAFPMTPDELGFVIRNSVKIDPNTWVEVDHLNFTGTNDQIPNNSFDNWRDIEYEDPISWPTTNNVSTALADITGVTRTTDSQDGSFAARIESQNTDDLMVSGIDGMFIANSPVDPIEGEFIGGTVLGEFNALRGYYKFAPNGDDQAVVAFLLLDEDRNEVGEGYHVLDPTSTYTEFEVPLVGENAHTAVIAVAPGFDPVTEEFTGIGGSVLYLDNFQLDIVSSTNDIPKQSLAFNAYMVEASNELVVELPEAEEKIKLTVFNAAGQMILENHFKRQINIRQELPALAEGVYIVHIKTTKKQGSQSFFKR